MKQIKDPVHGYISIPQHLVENIIDTKHFQRLRNLRQLDTTRLVYPAAGHSRFEHTLGVYHLGSTAFQNLRQEFSGDLSEKEIDQIERTLKCACLFHDIGHFPFSHLCEPFADESDIDNRLSNYNLKDALDDAYVGAALDDADPHEKMSCLIVLSEYKDWLEQQDLNPNEVCAFILGTSTNRMDKWQWEVAAKLLHSSIDVDRLDYMIRDDFMSGASLVAMDIKRMVNAYTTVDEGLALSENAHSTIGNYLDGRNAVYMWITQHHKVICTNVMIEKMVNELMGLLERDRFSVDQIIEYGIDDTYLIEKIRQKARSGESDYLSYLYESYRSRDLLSSCWKHPIDYRRKIKSERTQNKLYEALDHQRDRVEMRLRDEFDLKEHQVMAGTSYVPGYNSQELNEIYLDHGGTAQKITSLDIYDTKSKLAQSIPFVFVPADKTQDVIDFITENPPPWN